jgi:Raf kinase inhibitor-like YbhB/YbcL family protein
MGVIRNVMSAAGETVRDVRAGPEKLASRKLELSEQPSLEVTSPQFEPGQRLPQSATAQGDGPHEQFVERGGVPPALRWSGAPQGMRSFAVVCEDADAPLPEPFVHWLVYGIPATAQSLDASSAHSVPEGKNSTMKTGFAPAAPPLGHGRHHYHFQVFALDSEVDLDPGAGRGDLLDAMRGHVLAWGDLVGTFER